MTKLFQKYPEPNPFKQLTAKDVQIEVNLLKAQVRDLRQEIINLNATNLELHTQLSILETQIPSSSHIPEYFPNIENIPETTISEEQFLRTISHVTIQKWYSAVKIVFNDFSTSAVALIDSGADQNYIREGMIPTKYYERTKEQLCSSNGEPLNTRYKLNKGYIQNNGYCFKQIFLIVQNITHDIILGTPFLTQIYPFQVNESGARAKILGN